MGTRPESIFSNNSFAWPSQRGIAEAYGDMLGDHSWSHVSTLTFRYDTPASPAMGEFQRYVRRLEQRSQARVGWFVAAEQTHPGAAHLHAVLSIESLPHRDIQAAWTRGHSHLRRYQPSLGFTNYLTKQIGGRVLDYDLGGLSLPRSIGRFQ